MQAAREGRFSMQRKTPQREVWGLSIPREEAQSLGIYPIP